MYFITKPKYMFVAYSIDYEYGKIDFKVKFTIPFFTKEEAEKYKSNFLNNLQDKSNIMFIVVPLVEEE